MSPLGSAGRPQAAKLGLRPGQRVHLHHPPPGWDLTDPPDGLVDAGPDGPADLIISFFSAAAQIAAELDRLARRVYPDGALVGGVAAPGRRPPQRHHR